MGHPNLFLVLHCSYFLSEFFRISDVKFLSNSSIIQKISVTLSLVIIAYIFCNCLIFTHKGTKYSPIKVQNICEITNFFTCFLIPNSRINTLPAYSYWQGISLLCLSLQLGTLDILGGELKGRLK